MYGNVVHGLPRHELEKDDVISALEFYEKMAGPFPNAKEQVLGAIEAVFKSWNNDRAKFYRKMHDIPEDWGTAVVVQAMVFGNLNDNSCTGVMFTRNPDNGDGKVVGEFLVNAQGEDVVAGIRTPQNLSEMSNWNDTVAQEVLDVALKLEHAKRDVQDIEFTVQDGQLFVLQTRNAKRSARAAVKIAVEMMVEGLITKEEMAKRVTMKELDLAQQSILDPAFTDKEDFTGIPACSGVVTGRVVLSAQAAINCKEPCIMVTQETTPDDIAGMNAAKAVLTMTGGSTSHAAVVARGMNKPCVVGLSVDIGKFKDGAIISIDGATGRVWFGKVPVIDGSSNPFVLQFKEACWAIYNGGKNAQIVDRPKPIKVQVVRMSDKISLQWTELLKELCDVGAQADQIVLDFSPLHEVEAKFYGMFLSSDRVVEMMNTLMPMLEQSTIASKLSILGSKMSAKLPCLPVAQALEELILAEAEVIWVGEPSPAADKVLKWKALEGVKFSAIGVASEGGTSYVSESQMLGSLLR
jgi:phosphohistidine swiveling domain-containing protein